jgi:SAM-dependent methyltransferase
MSIDPYEHLAEAWADDADLVYGPLAEALVEASPMSLAGRVALDVGCGTGGATRALQRAGASVIGMDLSLGMLGHGGAARGPVANADVMDLPVATGSMDVVVGAFVLNHLPPQLALPEMGRVLAPGGFLLASTWPRGIVDPLKDAVDAVLRSAGWVPPEWYVAMKRDIEPLAGDELRLGPLASAAGFHSVRTLLIPVHLGVVAAPDAAAYRLAMPHVSSFLATMSQPDRSALVQQAVDAAAPVVGSWRPTMLVLIAHR